MHKKINFTLAMTVDDVADFYLLFWFQWMLENVVVPPPFHSTNLVFYY